MEGDKDPIASTIGSFLSVIWDMLSAILIFMFKILKFFLWAISAVIILPCVFVAGTLYPMWVEWGEDF